MELSPSLREHIEARLGSLLGRFGTRVASVTVCLAELRDSTDVWCLIFVRLEPSGKVMTEATEADVEAAVNHAADQIASRVSGVLDCAPATKRWRSVRHG
jgi:ribosome-associated translation inhibitor RaiA